MNTNMRETTMGSEMVPAPSGQMSLAETVQLAEIFTKSRFFADVREAAQAVVKILAGRELGFGPMASMTGIYIVNGRPSLGSNLMAATIKRSGKYDYRIDKCDGTGCELTFLRREDKTEETKGTIKTTWFWVEMGKTSFGPEDAARAGLDKKDTFQKYPEDMYFARALSKGYRRYCPDLTSGVVVYAEGEVEVDPPQIVSLKDTPELVHKVATDDNPPREGKPADVIDGQQYENIARLIISSGANRQMFLDYFKIQAVAWLPKSRYEEAISLLKEKERKGLKKVEPQAKQPEVSTPVPGLDLKQIMILNNLAGLADIPPAMLCSQLGVKTMDQVPAHAYLWLRLLLEEKADIADSLKLFKVQSITEVTEDRLRPLALNKLRARIVDLREKCGTEEERFSSWLEEKYGDGRLVGLTEAQLIEVESILQAAWNKKQSKEKAQEAVTQ